MADCVVVLNGGRLEQFDTPEAIYHQASASTATSHPPRVYPIGATVDLKVMPPTWSCFPGDSLVGC